MDKFRAKIKWKHMQRARVWASQKNVNPVSVSGKFCLYFRMFTRTNLLKIKTNSQRQHFHSFAPFACRSYRQATCPPAIWARRKYKRTLFPLPTTNTVVCFKFIWAHNSWIVSYFQKLFNNCKLIFISSTLPKCETS